MVVTVTLNPAVDKTLVVRGFRPGTTNRAAVDRLRVGGKGINVAFTLRRLDCEVVATGFLGGADRHGTLAALARAGIEADFVSVDEETRVNLKVFDSLTGVETEINEPGFVVPPPAIALLTGRLQAMASRAAVMVFSGSLPPGAPDDLYAQLVALARAQGVRTVLDTAGSALAHGIAAGPDLVKPNRQEAEDLLGTSIGDDDLSLATAAERILASGARSVVISLGPGGALCASSEGMWRAYPPRVSVRTTVGAGDAMVAGLAYALVRSLPASDALRLATAVSSAAAAASDPSGVARDIETLLPQVSIAPMPIRAASHASLPGEP